MFASRRRIGSLEILEGRRLMAADVAVEAPLALPDAPTALVAKPSAGTGATAALPASALAGGASRPASSASPAVQDAAFADQSPSPLAVQLETCLVSNWSTSGGGDAGAAYKLDRCFVKSWSTSGDADAPASDEINIGVGELQECTISKSMDASSSKLAQFAINGNSPGPAEIHFVEVAGGTAADADDRPTEEVAFYYNKISFNYAH
jgi:hypothetical protein